MSKNTWLSVLLGAFAIGLFVPAAMSQPNSTTAADSKPAIKGYSPVSYFEKGRAEKGSPRFSSTHEGREYHFTSAEQLETFEADPDAYAPLFPNRCPYNLSLGRAVAIDPNNFKIVGGRLLLFHDREEMNSVLQAKDPRAMDEMLERARSNSQFSLEF